MKITMKKILFICIIFLLPLQAFAKGDIINVPGESAHAAGGAVIAGVATAVSNKYWPEHRALIGFSFSTACVIIGEGIDRVKNGEKYSLCLQDVAFHMLGAAIGSLITDKFILMPVIQRDHAGSNYYGLAVQISF
jgi:hypothetical protein